MGSAPSPGECYETPAVALAEEDSMDGVIGEMTKYRRHIAGGHTADEGLPVVFNDYMHLSWDNPTEERTKKMRPLRRRSVRISTSSTAAGTTRRTEASSIPMSRVEGEQKALPARHPCRHRQHPCPRHEGGALAGAGSRGAVLRGDDRLLSRRCVVLPRRQVRPRWRQKVPRFPL